MIFKYTTLLSLLLAPVICLSQTAEEYEAIYAKRIQEEIINGVYIPADLTEAHQELVRLSDPAGISMFKNAPESEVARKLHFGLGKWILINWGLEDGSRISHYLRSKGVSQPDDMVRLIIVTWHRQLNQKPMLIEEEIEAIKVKMDAEKAERDADQKVIILEKRPHRDH